MMQLSVLKINPNVAYGRSASKMAGQRWCRKISILFAWKGEIIDFKSRITLVSM